MKFAKAHACGNDFLILSETDARGRHAELARKLCARTTAIGADGIEFVDAKSDGTYFLRLFNADGSEAELSGNGTRCVAALLAADFGARDVVFGTHGGKRASSVVRRKGDEWWMRMSMGVPRVMPRSIELDGIGTIEGAMVNVGNPHFVVFTDNEDFAEHGLRWQELGERIGTHPMFHHGTNVEFVRVLAADTIAFRIWERGVGPTMSSGTGTCASSAAAIALRGCARELTAIAEGGAQQVAWPSDAEELLLTGPAEVICRGEVNV